jgi:hypothetical protein
MIEAVLTTPVLLAARVPLLPLESIVHVYENLEHAAHVQRFRTPLVDLAVEIASTDLMRALDAPDRGGTKKQQRAALKFLAYLSRMSSRATPFGIFASVGMVQLGTATTLALDETSRTTRSRPDMEWLLSPLRAALAESWEDRARLRVRIADDILEQGGRLFFEPRSDEANVDWSRTPTGSVRVTREIDMLRAAAAGWTTLGALAERLAAFAEISPARACDVVTTLWDAGLFADELTPVPTSRDAIGHVVGVVRRVLPAVAPAVQALVDSLRTFDLDFSSGTADGGQMAAIVSAARDYHAKASPIQVDTHHRFRGTLSGRVRRELERYATLHVRGGYLPVAEGVRDAFRTSFEGEGRLVPFLEFADAALDRGEKLFTSGAADPKLISARAAVLGEIFADSVRAGALEVELSREQIDVLYPPSSEAAERFTPTFDLGFHVVAADASAIDRGDYQIWPALVFATDRAGATLARFADVLEVPIAEAHGAESALADCTTAELVARLQHPKLYNVAMHPPIQRYEVQLGLHAEHDEIVRISPADLDVRMTDEGILTLWSRLLGSRIALVENHVFNTRKLGSFRARLLATIATDGIAVPQPFDWGPFRGVPFTPRVRSGRLVLARARWTFTPPAHAGDAAWDEALGSFSKRWRVPRHVMFVLSDNDLLVDLESPVGRELLRAETKDDVVVLEELPALDEHWLRGASGRYVAEFVCGFSVATPAAAPRGSPPARADVRRIPSSSSWLYVQVFCSAHRFETLLRAYVGPLVERVRHASAHPLEWFFVRYRTTESHLRLRFRLGDPSQAPLVTEAVEDWAERGLVRRWATCAYERELERYGGIEGLALAERIFASSSDIAMTAIAQRVTDAREKTMEEAWRFGSLLLGELDGDELERLRPSGQHRKLAPWQRAILAAPQTQPGARTAVEAAIAEQARDLRDLAARGGLQAALLDVNLSLCHMHSNRLGLDRDAELQVRSLLWHERYRRTVGHDGARHEQQEDQERS